MSKYTTEVRFICEKYAGLEESEGYNEVADIIANSRSKVFDFDYKNSFDLGGAMAPSAIETLLTHFDDFKRKPSDYDLILTGDLSQIGFSVVSTALNDKFENVKNYDDCGLIVYDYFTQDVYSGGSGCGCSAVVTCGYIKEKLLSGEIKKVLICPTGALMNQTTTLQKESIPSISHCFVLERVEE
jgi:stage V sporulation protein AD